MFSRSIASGNGKLTGGVWVAEMRSLRAAGTKIIIDREGKIVYRNGGVTTYEKLRSEVDKAL